MRRTAIVFGLSLFGFAAALLLIGAPVAHASATVGSGTPQSCTEAAFDTALQQSSGIVYFNCGSAPYTLTLHEKVLSYFVAFYGGGLITLSGNDLNRVFSVTAGGGLFLHDLRVTNGFSSDPAGGAAINSAGDLSLEHSQVVHNTCTNLCTGAAILSTGVMAIENSTISENQTDVGGALVIAGAGGGEVLSSTISLNHSLTAFLSGGAGLAHLGTGGATLRDSSVISNSSASDAGGIYVGSGSTLVIVNSTVSGNTADGNGGGLSNDGKLWLYNATVTNNTADNSLTGSGAGGGIYNTNDFQFQDTILAGNTESAFFMGFWISHYGDCSGTLTNIGNNLMQNYNTSNCHFNGGTPTLAPPDLGPLQDNGGPTLTHLPNASSPVIDAGNPAGCIDQASEIITRDQRGFLRIGICDIGAVERAFQLVLPLVRR